MSAQQPPPKDKISRSVYFNALIKMSRILLDSMPFGLGPATDLVVDLMNDVKRSRTDLGEKVAAATKALEDASAVVSELEKALSEQMARVAALRAEYDRYSKLAEVEEANASAIIAQLKLTVDKGARAERAVNIAIALFVGLLLFVFGVVASPWLTHILGVPQ